METIGMIGLGAMGSALLERQRLAHVEQLVFDVDPTAVAAAKEAGAEPATSAAEIARASTLIDIVVRTDEEVVDCVLGPNGVISTAKPGTLVLLHSTTLPQTTQRVAAAAAEKGIHVIDACMLGVPSTVRSGNLIFLLGGPAELFERALPHLSTMGKEVRHVGPIGSGNVAKLIANLVSGAQTLVLWEALQLAEAGGIPYINALGLLKDVRSGSVLERWESAFDASAVKPTPRVGHNVMGKDVPLTRELAHAYGLDLPIIEQLGLAGLRLANGE